MSEIEYGCQLLYILTIRNGWTYLSSAIGIYKKIVGVKYGKNMDKSKLKKHIKNHVTIMVACIAMPL